MQLGRFVGGRRNDKALIDGELQVRDVVVMGVSKVDSIAKLSQVVLLNTAVSAS